MTVLPYEFSTSPERMFEAIAQDAPRGCYPRYLYGEQTYWAVVGVGDGKGDRQALLNEEGMLEVERGGFSIEPFLHLEGRLLTWNEAELRQRLERGYLPIPAVVRHYAGLGLAITVLAAGDGVIYSRYRVENSTTERRALRLFLAVRPFQVNPPWQSLNMAGGTASIHALRFEGRTLWVNGGRAVVSLTAPDRLGAAAFHQGLLADHLAAGALPDRTEVSDPLGHASAAFEYRLAVPPGGVREVYLAIPARGGEGMPAEGEPGLIWEQRFDEVARSWEARLGRVAIHLPPSLDHLTDTAKSTLAYILINRDGHALRPGTRCYARSWIRDGALIAAALLQMGHAEEVRDFILWYGPHQSENGKIPCRVDGRGPDPTPEHDSHGEFVYLVMEYHRYTQDRALLEALWPRVQKAIAHIEALRHERMTAAYRMPDKPQQAHAVPDDRIFATLTALDLDRVLARAGGIDVERDWDDILSLDEQQLLAAARVLYAAPRFAFLDRLATALSPTQEERVLQLLFARSISYVTITETDEPTDRYDAVLDLTGGGAWTWSQIPP